MDRGDLRGADTGDDARGADGARPDADLDPVDAGVDEGLGALAGGDVATDDLHVAGRGVALEPLDHLEQQLDVAVRGVGDEDVDAGVDEGRRPLPGVAEVADGGTDEQAALRVADRDDLLRPADRPDALGDGGGGASADPPESETSPELCDTTAASSESPVGPSSPEPGPV